MNLQNIKQVTISTKSKREKYLDFFMYPTKEILYNKHR